MSFIKTLTLYLAVLSSVQSSCKPRAGLEDKEVQKTPSELSPSTSGSEDADPAIELERLRLSNQETMNTLQLESLANDKRLLELSNELTRISIALSNPGLSEAERSKNTTQQTTLQTERSKLEPIQQALKARIAALKPKIEDIDSRIIELADELEALSPQEAEALRPRIRALSREISDLKSAQAVSGGNPTPSPTTSSTPVPTASPTTLPKGALSAMAYNFYYEEVNVKKDCIDLTAASTLAGAAVNVAPCVAARKSQVFKLENFPDQNFRMIAQHSNLCLYVTGASKLANAGLEQHICADPAQTVNAMIFKFREIDTDKGTFKIQNINSGMCLKINSDGRIIQGECNVNFTLFQTATVNP